MFGVRHWFCKGQLVLSLQLQAQLVFGGLRIKRLCADIMDFKCVGGNVLCKRFKKALYIWNSVTHNQGGVNGKGLKHDIDIHIS